MLATTPELLDTNVNSAIGNINNDRGLQVYTLTQLIGITGRDKEGNLVHGHREQALFNLTIDERLAVFKFCIPVQAVVTSRMRSIASLDFNVISEKKEEDRFYEQLKNYKAIYDEYAKAQDPKYIVARQVIYKEILDLLPDVLPDLSNFQRSLLRWRKRIRNMKIDQGEEIKNWMMEPNNGETLDSFTKKQVFDLMIHGQFSAYKDVLNNRLENVFLLAGGTVIPLKSKYVDGRNAYIQMLQGFAEPKIYFNDELYYDNYIPTTARAYGFIPLEALINKVTETLLFDELMANQADGTNYPEKMVIVTNNSPFGDMKREFNLPIDKEEQIRLEEKLNEPKKGRVMTFSGNRAIVLDISKENTMGVQSERQRDIREEVGLIFQATPMEMNLASGDNTSGRSTAEAQQDIYHRSGVTPIIKSIKTFWERGVLPYRYGSGWRLDYQSGKSEKDDVELVTMKKNSGVYAINEIREEDLNRDPIDDPAYDKPPEQSSSQGQPSTDPNGMSL